ncbi:hypothetical protein GCM10007871_03890 [Gluconobacter roseus NBRC 3990]|nr:hypothetical protein GCM10007871_03890 [Gluconobacter roseus NBRC 3990]
MGSALRAPFESLVTDGDGRAFFRAHLKCASAVWVPDMQMAGKSGEEVSFPLESRAHRKCARTQMFRK